MNEPFIVPVAFILAFTAIYIVRGPLGKALADRIAGRVGGEPRESERVLSELEALRHRVAELEERVDFAERLVARSRDAQLRPGA